MRAISTLQELHGIELDILRDIGRFCESNGLRYSLAGGTLLGAIRHKGFIPWDDDVDIMMPRPDYERFIRSYPSGTYSIRAPGVHPGAFRPFAKVVDTRTIIPNDDFSGEQPGVWVDVFPIDGALSTSFFPPKDSRLWRAVSQFLLLKNLRLFSPRRSIAKNAFLMATVPIRLLPNGLFSRVFTRVAAHQSFDSSPFRGCLVWGYGRREILSSAVFSDWSEKVPFESETFCAIKGWHDYLTAIYGDFMKLPPPEKQIPSHGSQAVWKENVET